MSEFIIIFLASKLHIVIATIAVIYFLFTTTHKKLKLIILGAISLPTSYVIGKLIGIWINTTRPFVALEVQPLIEHAADNGFPSEHTLYALIIAGVIWSVHKKLGVFLAILAILVGIGRILAFVHNPIDIVGSILIAVSIISVLSIPSVSYWIHTLTIKTEYYVPQILR